MKTACLLQSRNLISLFVKMRLPENPHICQAACVLTSPKISGKGDGAGETKEDGPLWKTHVEPAFAKYSLQNACVVAISRVK